MDRQKLYEAAVLFTTKVTEDPRWTEEKDELGLNVFGMILYGYTLAVGRLVMILEQDDVDAVIAKCLTTRTGVSQNWAEGFLQEALKSAFNPAHHPLHYELIGVGHSYAGVVERAPLVDNVFENIASIRKGIAAPPPGDNS